MSKFEFGNIVSNGVMSKDIGNLGLVAGAFDDFELENLINSKIGKEGSHVKADCGAITKALVMQMLNVPYQTLSGTEEYYSNLPLATLVQEKITCKDLGRGVLGRYLDSITEYGSEKLYLECAAKVIERVGITITEGHIDSTSFHYDGASREETGCELILAKGYSRDHRPDLNQAIEVMIADGKTRIPFYAKNVSGNINDKRSFNYVLKYAISNVREQFKEFKYLVGDSALCTPDNFAEAENQQMMLVTRMPDSCEFAKRNFESCKLEELTAIFDNNECADGSPLGKWLDDATIGIHKVKAMLVFNGNLREQKEKTLNKKAKKELEDLTAKIKKLTTQPCKCRADAEKAIDTLKKKCKFCQISDIVYEEKYKQATKGRPSKDGNSSKVLKAVIVTANVSIDEDKLKRSLDKEMMYILVTNDTTRKWTMAELLSSYKRNSVIERNWRCCKNPKLFIDAIYLKSPSRIDALLWLMSLALLVYAAMEYRIRQVMRENNLEIPSIIRGKTEKQPTMARFLQYVGNQRIHVIKAPDGVVYISNLPDQIQDILSELGAKWCHYFNSRTHEAYF